MEVSGVRDFRGSISLRAEETESGFRFFLEDDEESFFDLNLEKMPNTEEFEFQIAFSQPPAVAPPSQRSADALFRNGRILPLEGNPVSNSEAQVHPGRKLPLPRGSAPVEIRANPREHLLHGDRRHTGSNEYLHRSPEIRRTDLKLAERTNTGATKLLVRFPSERIRSTFASIVKPYQLLSPLHERSQSGAAWTLEKGRGLRKLVQRFSGCLGIEKKRPLGSGGAAAEAASHRARAAVDVDEAVVNTILDAVDFAVRSGRWAAVRAEGPRKSPPPRGAADRLTEYAMERNLSINSAIAHCKMSYSGAASLR